MNEKFLEHNIGIEQYITGNRFIDICEETGATFCKTDYLHQFGSTQQNVFVTHNSDYHINKDRHTMGPNYKHWFCQNKDVQADNIYSIPIGVENMKIRTSPQARNGLWSSQIKGAQEKALLINKINDMCFEKKSDVYMNFNIHTYPTERKYVWDKFSQENWVTKTNNISIEKFYLDIATHKFVLSPRGNGVDCHRTWEALYLRTIPIVKKSIHMQEFSDLPIFFVDNWNDLCYNKLQEFYHKVENTLYDLDKIKISYWKRIINERLLK